MTTGQSTQLVKLGMVPNATIVAQEILGNMDMSLVQTLKGITNVTNAIWFYIGRVTSSKVSIHMAEAVHSEILLQRSQKQGLSGKFR